MQAECPECGWSKEVTADAMGQKAKCPKCERVFKINDTKMKNPAKAQNATKSPPLPEKHNSSDSFPKKVSDHFKFRSFETPTLIQIIYALVFAIAALGIVVALLTGVVSENVPLGMAFLVIFGCVAALVVVRITLEGAIIIFSIHDRLKEISDELTS